MAYGRRRAAARVTGPSYAPHPGWRHLIAEGWRVLTDQAEALARVEALVDDQEWRSDKRAAWLAILRQLVYGMDWDTGLVAALTAHRLGAAGARAERTVSRVIAWARDTGLLVVVEHAASAEFLGTDHGRTPTYALVTTDPLPRGGSPVAADPAQLSVVDENGDPPEPLVENKPLNGRRQPPATQDPEDWPLFGVPQTPAQRTSATRCLLGRLSLDRGGVSPVPLWRARALLKPWWEAGASPAGLLHAIDRHPDHPDQRRGDALRGGRDPLRVLGHRLRPWHGRLSELPAAVTGQPADYRATQAERVERAVASAQRPGGSAAVHGGSTSAVRAAARDAVDEHLRRLRHERTRRT